MNTLPNVAIDLIFSFNPEHRENSSQVFDELLYKENTCYYCFEDTKEEERIAKNILFERYIFCSKYCCINGEEEIRGTRQARPIKMKYVYMYLKRQSNNK